MTRMKRALLIGDSIRMGYAPLVRERVGDAIEIVEIDENGGDSANIRAKLDMWLNQADEANLDLIQFNCGLHDIKRAFDSEEQQVSIEAYAPNLEWIVGRLKTTNAALVWATITPVMDDWHHANKGFDRFTSDVDTYNAVASAVMERAGIEQVNLHAVVTDARKVTCIVPDGVHMNERGNGLLADVVAERLKSRLS